MRGLFFTDSHLRYMRPRRRIDDFFDTEMIKMHEVMDIAKDKKVDAIFFGGDLCDVQDPSFVVFNFILGLLSENKIPFYSVVGQHDVDSHNMETLYKCGLGGLINAGMVHRLNDLKIGNAVFKGIDYTSESEVVCNFPKEDKDLYKIIITHNTITPKPCPFEHHLISDLETNADLVLCGDYHQPFDKMNGDTRYINPGSLVRLSKDDSDREKVSVILFDTETKEIEKINLESAEMPESVFDLKAMEMDGVVSGEIKDFMNKLNTVEGFDQLDLIEVIKTLAKENGIENDVRDEALNSVMKYMKK